MKPGLRTIVAIAIALALASGLLTGCSRKKASPPVPIEKIVVGAEAGLLAAAIWVAESKGYFKAQGLDARIVEFDSGRLALQAMLEKGGLDMVTVAQTPIVFHSFARTDYAIIAGMVTSIDDVKLVARRDAGIARIADLKGKRIGVTKGSTGHYFLGASLSAHGLRLADVEIVDFAASVLPTALAGGKVAAISTWEPHASKGRQHLGANAVAFDSQGIFREDFYFVAKREFIDAHPAVLQRFLKAIDQANADMATNPAEAIGIAAARLRLERNAVESLWNIFRFKLFLDHSILLALESEARWAIDSGLTDAKTVPNYLKFISADSLKAVKPAAISLIE